MCMIVPRSSGMRLSGMRSTPSIAEPLAIGAVPEHDLSAVERFGLPGRRVRLHASKAHERMEEIGGEPLLVELRGEVLEDQLDLALRNRLAQWEEEVRRAE